MNNNPEQLALRHIHVVCQGHAETLTESLQDMQLRRLSLGWLPSADEWLTLRQVRNQFAHDYPDSLVERFERLQAASHAARQLLEVMALFHQKIIGIAGHSNDETLGL